MPDAPAPPPTPARLVSLDALRGFDMFWILGSGGVFKALRAFGPVQPAATLTDQLEHVPWEGFHFEDLIFPLFVFIAGVSLVFALPRVVEREGRAVAARRVAVRALVLFTLGLLYYGGLTTGLDGVRWGGVLQRIAIAYLGAGLLFLWLKPRGLALACGAILAGYAALLLWVPVPEVSVAAVVEGKKVFIVSADRVASGAGRFAEGQNVSDYTDRHFLPGRRLSGDHDPEGLLSNLPAIASCLLGVGAGLFLRREADGTRKALTLAAAGAVLVLAGWAWWPWLPVIKKIWTPSYVLFAGGWSALLLAAFYWVIDVRGWARWARPFVWIGMNPITLYLLASLLDFTKLGARFTGGEMQRWLNVSVHAGAGDLLTALTGLGLCVLLARWLYVRKIFLRV